MDTHFLTAPLVYIVCGLDGSLMSLSFTPADFLVYDYIK